MIIKNVKVKTLKQDPELILIRKIQKVVVSKYRQNMRAGAIFPRPIIDKKTNRICSGNHTCLAYIEEYGPDHIIEVEVIDFRSQREFLTKSLIENNSHGAALTGVSKRLYAQKLESLGANKEEIAELFNINPHRVETWADGTRILTLGKVKREIIYGEAVVKHGADIPKNEPMTPEQYDIHMRSDLGVPGIKLADQLTRHLKNGWIDLNDKRNIDSLQELYYALHDLFRSGKKKTG